jgi:hypothetical protein
MIDWFVVLIPLALLPIVLLLGFLGCPLDRDGQGTPVTFSYPPVLNDDVQRFEAVFDVSDLKNEDGDPAMADVPPISRVDQGTPPLLAAGEEQTVAGFVGLGSHGWINCTCTLTLQPADDLSDPVELGPMSWRKYKNEDEDIQGFRLSRIGNSFELI